MHQWGVTGVVASRCSFIDLALLWSPLSSSQDAVGPENRTIRMEIIETLLNEGTDNKNLDQKSRDVLNYLKGLPFRKQVRPLRRGAPPPPVFCGLVPVPKS
jgi:hypothetical protein